mmetsp:Transcript_10385/g.22153  ORF Transcript_10385/g.22153 Transcript_10385/m.22153 type:complete len:92 (-) Transcript_10385:27-302(-)
MATSTLTRTRKPGASKSAIDSDKSQKKIEPSIWQNYRPLKKPEDQMEPKDPHAAGPYLEKIFMTFVGVAVLGTLANDVLVLLWETIRLNMF